MLIERASRPLHFPKDINSSSIAVNTQATAQAATSSSVIGRNLLSKKLPLSRWKVRPMPREVGVQTTSSFANDTPTLLNFADPTTSVVEMLDAEKV